ncbi:MAG: TolC family protein [Butyricicoccus sp.]|nr:TolC family protein [Butyricicoccus sp.]
MKKRICSAFLACAMLATTSAAAVDIVIPAPTGGTTTVTVDTTNDPLLDLFVQEMTPQQLADFLAAQDPEAPAANMLSFADIAELVQEDNLTILANEQIIPANKAKIDDAIEQLEDGIDALEDGIAQMEVMEGMYDGLINGYLDDANLSGNMEAVMFALMGGSSDYPISLSRDEKQSGGLALLLMSDQSSISSQIAQLEAQIDDLEDQIDELEDTDFDAVEMQLDSAVDQITMGAETLYIALHTIQSSYDGLLRQEAILNMQLTTMEKRYELGQVSAVDVAMVRDGLRQLTRGKENLEMTMRNSKGDLNLLLGRDMNENFTLAPLPVVTTQEILDMDLERDLKRGMGNSFTIWQAEEALDTAKDGDGSDRKYNVKQAEYQLESAENSFRLAFTKQFRAVEDAARAVQAATDARGFKITELGVAKTKYELGKISYNDYIEAQTNMAQADADLKTAQNDLYLAYNNYQWAIRGVTA